MIYGDSGSSSYFGTVLVPVPVSVPFPDPHFHLAQFSTTENLYTVLSFLF
jgi:hypothetical protein